MTPKSLCAIASITKSFTVTNLGMLIDEGKGGWDLPVRSVFPAFKLYDPVLTEQMTVRDLVTHRSGLPRHDMVWYSSDFSRDDLIDRKSTRLNSSHSQISYAVFCLKKKQN